MNYTLSKESLKYPQIEFAFKRIYEKRYSQYLANGMTDVVEFGVYKGGSLEKICRYVKDNEFDFTCVYGIDSWEGLPVDGGFSKFSAGAYKAERPNIDQWRKAWNFDPVYLINKKFSDLKSWDSGWLLKCMLVHIDCDLMESTQDAFKWLCENHLIGKGTLLAFDEFMVGDYVSERTAFVEAMCKYNFEAKEIFHYLYTDKDVGDEVRQSLWEITQYDNR